MEAAESGELKFQELQAPKPSALETLNPHHDSVLLVFGLLVSARGWGSGPRRR